jgi:hypothetical protein
MQHTSSSINSIGFTITFQSPYNECEWRTQTFPTREEAENMIEFYKTCGTHAELV